MTVLREGSVVRSLRVNLAGKAPIPYCVDRGRYYTIRLPAFSPKTTAAACTISFRTCLVNVQTATVKIRPIDGSDSFLALSVVCHLNEAEATRLARVPIRDDVDPINSAVGFKQRTDRFFRSPKTEISNVNVLQVYFSFDDLKAANWKVDEGSRSRS